MSWFGDFLDNFGTALNLPEFGWSESASGNKATANTGRVGFSDTGGWLNTGSSAARGVIDQARAGSTTSGGGAPGAVGGGAPVDASVVGGAGAGGGAGFAAQAAADAARKAQAAKLRGDITGLANTIKDIFNARYGQVDQSATEQTGKLNERFGNESRDITTQVDAENAKLGAAHAASGTYDSSYRGNNVDTVTRGGEGQIRDLGDELRENLAKIAAFVTQQKAGFDAQKGGMDAILSRLAEETDPNNLSQIRSSLDGRIADLRASNADNNTTAQNMESLNTIAPSNVRAQQLKTTLSQIVAGSADKGQKAVIGQRLIDSANLTDQEKRELLGVFQGDLEKLDKKQPQVA